MDRFGLAVWGVGIVLTILHAFDLPDHNCMYCAVIGHRWDRYIWIKWDLDTGVQTSGLRCRRCGHKAPR